ncbi:MAG TPA: NUDIX domain-containing protein [Spirochaetia bacterium]|nr:NUDIX domain-containing protein [Spirochaetia bacterium]
MDDRELLAVLDAEGRQIGIKTRAQAHADGDWHRLVFVLAARREANGRSRFLLQLRSRPGDRYQGQADVLAGGHVGADESHLDCARRECREETALDLDVDELLYLGCRRLENPTGVCRRVFQHFYLCLRKLTLTDPSFTDEASGFLEVDLDEFDELLADKRSTIAAIARTSEVAGAHALRAGRDLVSAYSEETIESFRRSIRAVRYVLDTGRSDASLLEDRP